MPSVKGFILFYFHLLLLYQMFCSSFDHTTRNWSIKTNLLSKKILSNYCLLLLLESLYRRVYFSILSKYSMYFRESRCESGCGWTGLFVYLREQEPCKETGKWRATCVGSNWEDAQLELQREEEKNSTDMEWKNMYCISVVSQRIFLSDHDWDVLRIPFVL